MRARVKCCVCVCGFAYSKKPKSKQIMDKVLNEKENSGLTSVW